MVDLVIGIRYLTGYAVATSVASRERPEWPPHPARVFMALTAAHFETGEQGDEAEALRWLEGLPDPSVHATDADQRRVVTSFVPTNDTPTGKGMLQSVLGLTRGKQPRTFPRVRPHDERVYLVWPDAEPNGLREALERLCAKVTRIGHSSSLVQMWLDNEVPPDPNLHCWEPNDVEADVRLRVFGLGSLGYLEQQFGGRAREDYHRTTSQIQSLEEKKKSIKGRGSSKLKAEVQQKIDALKTELPEEPPRDPLRPVMSLWRGYQRRRTQLDESVAGTVWDPHLVVRRLEPMETSHRHLDLVTTLQVTAAMHRAVLKMAHERFCGCNRWKRGVPKCGEARECYARIPVYISGHDPDCSPTEHPHLAYLPLAFVGTKYAAGQLMGLAVAVPATLNREQRREALAAVGQVRELTIGQLGRWKLDTDDQGRTNLRSDTWTGGDKGATDWATVTPISFDQHSKAKDRAEREREQAQNLTQGCSRIGLPEPAKVIVMPVSGHLGNPPAHEFPRLQRKDGSDRRHAHAILIFDRPVRGPIVLGAGRYRGYGFCRPLLQGEVIL